MTTLKLIAIFLVTILYGCIQKSTKHKVDPAAIQLNDMAMTLVPYIDNADSARKAISFLDKATDIDSNYSLGYSNRASLKTLYKVQCFDQ